MASWRRRRGSRRYLPSLGVPVNVATPDMLKQRNHDEIAETLLTHYGSDRNGLQLRAMVIDRVA
jgi:hypothetical protein